MRAATFYACRDAAGLEHTLVGALPAIDPPALYFTLCLQKARGG